MADPSPAPLIADIGAKADSETPPAAGNAPPPLTDPLQQIRLLEALIFAATEPLDEATLASRLGPDADLKARLRELQAHYRERGLTLVCTAGRWWFRTATDLAPWMQLEDVVSPRKLSRAAIETLAIIAYHQPVTRAEIESIRGVATNKGVLDLLMEAGWIKPGRRRETPGRPLTWLTTDGFLDHFGLESLRDLPGIDDLKAAGLLDTRPAFGALPGSALPLREAGSESENDPEHDRESEREDDGAD